MGVYTLENCAFRQFMHRCHVIQLKLNHVIQLKLMNGWNSVSRYFSESFWDIGNVFVLSILLVGQFVFVFIILVLRSFTTDSTNSHLTIITIGIYSLQWLRCILCCSMTYLIFNLSNTSIISHSYPSNFNCVAFACPFIHLSHSYSFADYHLVFKYWNGCVVLVVGLGSSVGWAPAGTYVFAKGVSDQVRDPLTPRNSL